MRRPRVKPVTLDDDNEVAEALKSVAKAIRKLGWGAGDLEAVTPMGAIEALAKEVRDGTERISDALRDVAEALRERTREGK